MAGTPAHAWLDPDFAGAATVGDVPPLPAPAGVRFDFPPPFPVSSHPAANPRASWLALVAVWLASAMLVLLHQAAERDYLTLLDGLGRHPNAELTTPLRQVIPARHADAQMWVRHALAQQETGALRLRFTPVDNAPAGREVHWSSLFLWLLRSAAGVQQALTGEPGALALERTLLWFNAPLLLLVLLGFSLWCARRGGIAAGLIVAAALVGHNRFYEAFAPANVDHHGLINAALLGMLLGVAFMGAGWWQAGDVGANAARWLPSSRRAARSAAILGGACGGLGIGLSAAAAIPIIALAGLAGLAGAWSFGRRARSEGAEFDPALWRLWGGVGAATALVIYVFDYVPSHLGLRLEVNHPFHALAWWGGSEIVAQLAAWRVARVTAASGASGEGQSDASHFRLHPARLIGAVAALAVAPVTVFVAGPAAFLINDPFVAELRHFVAEGRSVPAFIRQMGVRPLWFDLAMCGLLVPAGIVLIRCRGAAQIAVGWLALTTAGLLVLTFFEVRWGRTASSAQITLLLVLAASAVRSFPPRRQLGLAAAVAALLLLPAIHRVFVVRGENRAGRVVAGDLLQPLYRDLAASIRTSQPKGEIILLASPNASAGIAYFGQFRTLGTLFWENVPGLRAAAEIFTASTDEQAFRRLRERKVTHLALLERSNFLGEYHALLHPGAAIETAKQTFGYRLLTQRSPPPWLQPIPYRPPAELREAAGSVRLFKVMPDQDEVDWLFYTAVAHVAAGDAALGERTLESAVGRVPVARRADVLAAAGSAFYDFGADAIAARLLQRSLQFDYQEPVALTYAWILATSREDSVRDGVTALMLAEPVARANPGDPTAWSALAAAQAELRRFPQAVSAAERALSAARAAGDLASVPLLERRLETFRAGRPWRD